MFHEVLVSKRILLFSSSEDELDKLTRSFEEQATKDLQHVSRRLAEDKHKKQRSIKETREEALQKPVSEQSKRADTFSPLIYPSRSSE